MKIIQLSTFFYPSIGGVERQAEEISTHLHKLEGYEVEVLTTDATHGKVKRMNRLDDMYQGVPVRRFRYLFSLGYFFRFAPGLIWALIREEYDLVHVHNIHDGHLILAIIIKSFRRKKLVVTGHNPYVVSKEKRGERLSQWVSFYDKVLRLFLWRIDRYIALLQSEKKTVIERFKLKEEQVVVVPNGIQEIFYEDGGEATRFYREWKINPGDWDLIVGSVGRLHYVKGLQNLAAAAKALPNVLFIFAGGDDGYLSSLRRIYREYDNVLLTEQYIPSNEVRDFYKAIGIFLLPSIYEPFGMTIVEAMAQGKPVIVTDTGGPIEIVLPEFGAVLDPKNQDAWADKIREFVSQTAKIPQMAMAAKKRAERYRWQNVIARLVEVYEKA